MDFEIDVSGIDDIRAKLDKLKRGLMDWNQTLAVIGKAFQDYYSSVPFASRGTVFGQQWEDLNPAYATWKAKNYPGRPILVRSGDLQKGFFFVSSNNEVKLSNKVVYFKKHQFGEGVPQRISMALNDERKKAASDIIRDDIQKKVNAL